MSSWPPNDEYSDFRNALEQGIRSGDIATVRSLVTQPNRPPWCKPTESLRDVFKSRIEIVAQTDNDESVEVIRAVLLEWRDEPGTAEPTSQDLTGALCNAVQAGNSKLVEELIQNGVELSSRIESAIASTLRTKNEVSYEILNTLVKRGWKLEDTELLQYILLGEKRL
jgi:hypothetical protein